jgi:TP901 family phage tail tape measure protein
VELFADDSKLVRGLRRAERRVKAFGKHISSLGRKLAGLGAAFATPIALSTRVFTGFDDQMRAVQAVLGATGQQFDRLNEKAKKLGRTTSFTAAQVAGAMLELGWAGFDALQIYASIASVLDLARATGTELPMAANIAAGTLRAFNLEADQMGRVADVMTATANNSAQTLEDLGEAMKYAAPVADAYGLSLEETTKILGALANFSIKGSMAGNTLKNIMLQLANADVREKLARLGVATTDAAGNMLEVSEVLRNLGNAIRDMPRAQRLSIMNELFGKRAVAGGIKLTAASFDRLNEAIEQAGGTARRTAETMDSGIGGALRRLWSAVEGVAIGIGESLAGAISDLADSLGRAAGMITAWIKENRELVVTVVKVVAAVTVTGVALIGLGAIISGLGSALGVLATVVSRTAGVFGLLASAVSLLLSPIGLVITAVVGLGVAILHATGAGAKALAWLGDKFNVLKEDAVSSYQGIADALAAGDIALAAKILWLALKMEWTRGINFLEKAWLDFRNFFIQVGVDAWHGLLAAVEVVWHSLQVGWIETTAFLSKTWAQFTGWVQQAWHWTGRQLAKAWNFLRKQFDSSFDADAANRAAEEFY